MASTRILKSWSARIGWPRTSRTRNVRVVEVDVDTKAYDEGHVPGAIAWAWNTQLCDTVVRDILPKAAVRSIDDEVRHRQRHHRGSLWRQQQLVRRLGVLADEDLRPQGRPHHGWRTQEVAGSEGRDLDTKPRSRRRRQALSGQRARTTRCARSCRRCSRRRNRTAPSLIDVRSPQEFTRRDSGASRDCPKPASAAVTFPARAASPGARPAMTTARSSRPTSLQKLYGAEGVARIQAGDRLLPHRRALQPHLVRAEVPARLRATCRTTTAPGPSGAIWWARRWRRARPRQAVQA